MFSEADWHWLLLSPSGTFMMVTTTVRAAEEPRPVSELDAEELEARFGLTDMDWVRYISTEEVQALGEDRISEAATVAASAAAGFSAMTVSASDEAKSALITLQNSLAAVRDARDAGSASQAAAIAVDAFALVREIAVSTLVSDTAASMTFGATEVVRRLAEHADNAGFAGIDSGLVDDAVASAASANASLSSLEAAELDPRSWTPVALAALDPVFGVASGAVLSHSTAHAAFAQSLSESCR